MVAPESPFRKPRNRIAILAFWHASRLPPRL